MGIWMPESVQCPACSSRRVELVERWPLGKRARALACRDCGLLFVHSLETSPSSDEAATAGLDLTWLSAEKETASSKKGAALAMLSAFEHHFSAVQPPAGARMLGMGWGASAWLNVFRERGWETFEIRRTTDAGGRHRLLDALPTDGSFDLVIAYHVLERQARPLDALRALVRTIRPGGYCFVSVPRLDTLAEHRNGRSCLQPRKRLAAFTEPCLRGLLARAGLEAVVALHDLDNAFTSGKPLRLRLLARKVDVATPVSDPAAALDRVLDSVAGLDLAAAVPPLVPEGPTACPACDSADVHVVDEWHLPGHEARAAACGECGLLFVHPQPSGDALAKYYAPDGGWSASRQIRSSPPANRTEGAASSLLPALDRFLAASRPQTGATVFDFGCGDGAWLNTLQDRGWDTYGLEPSTDAAFSRHKRLIEVPREPQFDLVLVYHVLEHLPRPLHTLRALGNALRPGGYCLVSVPRLDTLAVHKQVDYCLHPRHHVVGFTEACLRGLLARSGLAVVQSFHDLESAHSRGLPVRLQLLARKDAERPDIAPQTAHALRRVVEAFITLKRPASRVAAPPRC